MKNEFVTIQIEKAQAKQGKKRGYAAKMRKKPTATERILWAALRRKQLGVIFRRQAIIGPFIADFYCAAKNLIVEVDGNSHFGKEEYDSARDKWFAGHKLKTLRISGDIVWNRLDEATDTIRQAINLQD